MRLAILTSDQTSWEMRALVGALETLDVSPVLFHPASLGIVLTSPHLLYQGRKVPLPGLVLGRLEASVLEIGILELELLAACGIRCVNGASAFRNGRNKALTSARLYAANLPHPPSALLPGGPLSRRRGGYVPLEVLPYPNVRKPLVGSMGKGVELLKNRTDFRLSWQTSSEPVFLQQYLKNPGRDIRVFVVGDQAVAAMYRWIPPGGWKANVACGGKPAPCELKADVTTLAVAAAKSVEADIAGVDLIEGPDGLAVIEVNVCPQFRALTKVTGIEIADRIASYLLAKAAPNACQSA